MMMKLINNIWFLRRDIISDGFDEALRHISKIIPLEIHKIATGTKCWTWTVPEKWSVKEGYIQELSGKKVLDLKDHPLHVMSYSLPINKVVSRAELLKHLHTKKERPNAIPFEFKYYERDWGFCMQHNRLKSLKAPKYEVFIDSKFEKGHLAVGDFTVKGEVTQTIVLIAHLCHPCQVNDDLTGVAVLVDLAKEIRKRKNFFTYKFLLVPETIGSIAYLSQNEDLIPKLKYGIFLEMLGNNNEHALQLTRQGDAKIDRIARYVMQKNLKNFKEGAFRTIVSNDEMVFNGPGVNIPTISISRWPYSEYHTSDDNLKIISEKRLEESKKIIFDIINILENDYTPKRKFKGPVFLSGCGLWVDWRKNKKLNHNVEQIMLNMEGDKSVFDTAQELEMDFDELLNYIDKFLEKGLIEK